MASHFHVELQFHKVKAKEHAELNIRCQIQRETILAELAKLLARPERMNKTKRRNSRGRTTKEIPKVHTSAAAWNILQAVESARV
jgi:hypothetical protein